MLLMGKSTISMAIFQFAMLVYQRVPIFVGPPWPCETKRKPSRNSGLQEGKTNPLMLGPLADAVEKALKKKGEITVKKTSPSWYGYPLVN